MPQGVEHLPPDPDTVRETRVRIPLMPQGVEHRVRDWRSRMWER